MKYLFVVVAASFVVSWTMPDSIETKYDHDRYFYVVENWPAIAGLPIVADTFHAPAVRDSSSAGLIFYSIESTVPGSIRFEYRVRTFVPSNPDTFPFLRLSDPSRIVSGLCLDWTEGSAERIRFVSRTAFDDLLVVYLRSLGWLCSWRFYTASEKITARYRFDFNGDELLNLSDFTLFGTDYGLYGRCLWELSDLIEFGINYNYRAYYELDTEGR